MYVISVAARLVELHPQTLRHYETLGLVVPKRSEGNQRLYSQEDVERLRLICRLSDDLGVNLAGIEVILNLTEQMRELHEALANREQELRAELAGLRQALAACRQSYGEPRAVPLPPEAG